MSADICIRLARLEDASAIAAIYAPFVRATAISFETEPPSVNEIAERIRTTLPAHPWLVASVDGEVGGYAYGSSHRARLAYRWSTDVSVYIDARFHRRGLGRSLYVVLLESLRRQGFHRAYGGITLPNAASVGLHERLGFRPLCVYRQVGFKLGEWRDVGWWELELAPAASAPSEPKTIEQIETPWS